MNTQTEVPIPKILFSKREAALALSLSVRTIENLIARKELNARRVGRRTLITASSLVLFARRDHVSPSPPKRSSGTTEGPESSAHTRELE
jgi:excisionase family DNA binding protein